MGTANSYGFIPNSTKVASGHIGPEAFKGGRAVIPYHTQGCGQIDYVLSNPVGVWEHPEVGRYIIDPKTTFIRGARLCGSCERLASGWKPKPRDRDRENAARRARRARHPKPTKVARTCSKEDCSRVHYGRGFCRYHWNRLSRYAVRQGVSKDASERKENASTWN